jgi:hypothetical protein
MMDVAELHAKEAALRQLAHAHDHWSEQEQVLRVTGTHVEAEGAHQLALVALRAYRAELDNPEPKEPTE